MQPERDSRCFYHEVCDEPICDGVGHCKDAAPIVEVQKPSTNSPMREIALIIKTIVNSQGAAFIGMSDVNKRLDAVIAQLPA